MKIVHVSPTYFGDPSVVGGGERYAYELAKAMAEQENVVFLSFADAPTSYRDGALSVEYVRKCAALTGHPRFNPFSSRFLRWIRWADVIHCHQVRTMSTDIPLLLRGILGKHVFVTDLGGGERYALSYHLPLLKQANALLLLSEFSRSHWHRTSAGHPPARCEVISGGVDVDRFSPKPIKRNDGVLFVGRILPHKGIDYLLKAVREDITIAIVGRVYDEPYYAYLRRLGASKQVEFSNWVSDEELVRKYRQASMTVLPSVYDDCGAGHTDVPELLGLAALESMACETPVIVTSVGALPEIVEDGVTGFVVPPNDPEAIRERIDLLLANPEVAQEMGRAGREQILARFTWDSVVERCLAAYRTPT